MERKNDLASHKNRKLSRRQLRILYKKKNTPFGPKDQQSQSKAETHLSDSKWPGQKSLDSVLSGTMQCKSIDFNYLIGILEKCSDS